MQAVSALRPPAALSKPAASKLVGRIRGITTVRCQKEQPARKQTTEEINARQTGAGAEPGGALGGLDPGSKPSGSTGRPQELHVDRALIAAMRPLLQRTRAGLAQHHGDTSSRAVGAAAVAAAEASGALPPLAGQQRAAVESFFARLAAFLEEDGELEGFEDFRSEVEGEDGDDLVRILPQQRELLEAVVNAHLASQGATRHTASPSDSVKAGGEVGNIALQSDTHGSEELRGVPVEDQAAHAARLSESQFQQLELGDLPAADASDFERQRKWEQHPWENQASHAAIEGDAPAAGDGLQVLSPESQARQLGNMTGSEDKEPSGTTSADEY